MLKCSYLPLLCYKIYPKSPLLLNKANQLRPANRVKAGKVKLDIVETPSGKKFRLLNLPYFLGSKIEEHVEEVGNS